MTGCLRKLSRWNTETQTNRKKDRDKNKTRSSKACLISLEDEE
jgi:hypothetical protein